MVIAEIMKIFVIFLFIHLTNAGSDIRIIECKEGCKQGPIKLPYYFCQCPLTVNPELSVCIQHCVNDLLCRFCYGDEFLGLPPLCPLVIDQEIDLSGNYFDFTFKSGAKISGLDKGKGTDLIFFDPVTRFGRAVLLVDKLTIEGEYKIEGKFCDDKVIKSEGYLKITFENLTVDWYPQIDIVLKCNEIYFFINGIPKSNLTLSTNKKIKFEFIENSGYATNISKCVDNSGEVVGKIINQLQQFTTDTLSVFSNIILLQVPVYNVFKVGAIVPLTSIGIPEQQLPLQQGGIPLPLTPVPGGVLPGGSLPGGNLIANISNLIIPPVQNILSGMPNSIPTNKPTVTSNPVTKKPLLQNLLSGISNLLLI